MRLESKVYLATALAVTAYILAAFLIASLTGCAPVETSGVRDFDWHRHDHERREYWARDHDDHCGGTSHHDGHRR